MRIPEKTIELNLCKDLPRLWKKDVLWFGLTQKQEARAGFDACAKIGAKLLLLQFKASNHYVGSAHRFHGPHHQMQALRDRVRSKRLVYYVFPAVGSTHHLKGPNSIVKGVQFLDVASLPAIIPVPLANGRRTPRVNMRHYIDVYTGHAVIHSDPFQVRLESPEGLFTDLEPIKVSLADEFEGNFRSFWRFISEVRQRGMYGVAAV
ncbi:hypothetical protein [Lysobacter hankyongensis]|uniref:Uncharacterized protein n=1 Tax=Lysobacter hankyongensis TaxID=1176535 RepID=A0ABP9ATU8_9GAMM